MTGTEGKSRAAPAFRLRQILAANAGPMTGPGTTTYLLSHGVDAAAPDSAPPAHAVSAVTSPTDSPKAAAAPIPPHLTHRAGVVIIDPGPDDPAHLAAILAALDPGEGVAAILITHPHLDHSPLAAPLAAATGAPVLAYGPAGSGRSAAMATLTALGLEGGAEGIDHAFQPDHPLRDGMVLHLGGLQIRVLHTPGHMGEHLSFACGDDVFCGDLVMAWAPSLVSPPEGDMADYMRALQRVAALRPLRLWPTHGAMIADPAARIAALIAHRLTRKAQVLAALAQGPAALPALTARVYHATPPALWPAASRNLLAHLIELMAENRVAATPWPAVDAEFTLTADQATPPDPLLY